MQRRRLHAFECQTLAALRREHLDLHGGFYCLQGYTGNITAYALHVRSPNQHHGGADISGSQQR
jgi:hypothetical protein